MQSLLMLDFAGAVEMNVLVFLFVPFIGALGVLLLLPALGKRSLLNDQSAVNIVLWSIVVIALVFAIIRNII